MLMRFDDSHATSTDDQQNARDHHHRRLVTAYQREDETTTKGSHNLRDADGTVEEAQIGPHVTVSLQGIRHEGERHGKHGSPGAADEQERNELHILVVDERNHGKADSTQQQTQGIGCLGVLEARQNGCPDDTAHGLDGKQDAHPVTSRLERLTGRIGGVPNGLGNGSRTVVPHIEEG